MDELFTTTPLYRLSVVLPSPFPATIKTPESRMSYMVEWHAACDVQLRIAPTSSVLKIGGKVPHIVFEGRLFRRVYGPEGQASLEQLLEVAPYRLLGGAGVHADPWWVDHPLAMHLDTPVARAFPGMLRPPGADDWWKEGRISPDDLGRELMAKRRGEAAADRIVVLSGSEPYQQVDIPGWAIAVGAHTSTERWVRAVPVKPFYLYLPYWWRASRMGKSWESLDEPSMRFGAALHAHESTLQAVALTMDSIDEDQSSPKFLAVRSLLKEAREAVDVVHSKSIDATFAALVNTMSIEGTPAIRQYGIEIGRHMPDLPT